MTSPPELSDEELSLILRTANVSKIDEKDQSEDEVISLMKDASIKANFSSLGIPNFEEKAREHHVEKSGKSAITLPPRDIFIGADLHGCETDLDGILKTYFNYLFNEEDVRLVLLGDYVHGLQALKQSGLKEVPAGPAYPDKSLEVILKIIELRDLLGDRFVPLIGDHDFSLVYPEFSIHKYGINQTKEFNDKLTEEQRKYLKQKVSKFPIAARTQNHYVLVHAGAAPVVESWEQLENLKLSAPSVNDRLKWMNETIEGGLLMGKHEKIENKEVRIISAEDNEKFLSKLDAKALITGHSGRTSFYFEKGGKRTKYHGAPGFIFNKGNQAVIVTTEGNGYEKGRDEKGTNNYGKQFVIDSMAECGSILYSDIGSDAFKSHPIDLEELTDNSPQVIAAPATKENPLIGKILAQAGLVTKRGGFDEELYRNLVANQAELKKYDIKVLERTLSHFNGTKDSGLPKRVLPPSYFMKSIPNEIHAIFRKSEDKK